MLWKGRRTSGNVEDRRGMGGGGKLLGGGIGAAVLGLIIYLLGGDPSAIINQGESAPQTQEQKAAEDEAAQFVSVVLADTEDVWNKLFSDMGKQYQEPSMVLFNGSGAGIPT